MSEKTHWKKCVAESTYLGEADFQEGEEKVVTISKVIESAEVKTAEGTSKKAVVCFEEKNVKPMILNVAKSKNIAKVVGSPYFEDWPGHAVQLYVEHGIRAFGEVVSAVRVRPRKPIVKQAVKCSACGNDIKGASGKGADYIAQYTKQKFGKALCFDCAKGGAAEDGAS